MPTLHWIGKEKVVNHHLSVPYHTLREEYTFNSPTQGGGGISYFKMKMGRSLEARQMACRHPPRRTSSKDSICLI
jgi:adenine-specific DNA-methyltransferase